MKTLSPLFGPFTGRSKDERTIIGYTVIRVKQAKMLPHLVATSHAAVQLAMSTRPLHALCPVCSGPRRPAFDLPAATRHDVREIGDIFWHFLTSGDLIACTFLARKRSRKLRVFYTFLFRRPYRTETEE